jgi:osmotically-inducible protein OsmY
MRGSQDQLIIQLLNNKLASRGLSSPCHVAVHIKNGEVTLSGSVQYAHQKDSAAKLATGIRGVSRIVNQLTVMPLKR